LKLTDYINKDFIFLDLPAQDKQDALHQAVQLLKHNRALSDADDFLREVLQREELGSTCVGQGVAIPHARTKTVTQIILALLRLKEPVDFGAEDKQPVRILFMLGTPVDKVGEYLKVLAAISRLMCQPLLRDKILQAGSPREVIDILMLAEKDSSAGLPPKR
jgi:fructose-specific phosphotransferase system IIA component